MPSLFGVLRSSAEALDVFDRVLSVTQNNVANASTPGYVRQDLALLPALFDPDGGVAGGVEAGQLQSARDQYAEAAVRRQTETLGRNEQLAASLGPIQLGFDISGQAGIPGALNQLFGAFSAWSVAPNDPGSQQAIIDAAETVAQSFQRVSSTLGQTAADTQSGIRSTVDQINALGEQIRQFNISRQGDSTSVDPALDADVNNALEQLSELANVTTLRQRDGSYTVLLGGQAPLVVGANGYRVAAAFSTVPAGVTGPVSAQILDASGADVTCQITNGRLGGLLEVHNQVLASLRGDGAKQGDLNVLAQSVADTVNAILTNNGAGPNPPLLSYGNAAPTAIASVLRVNNALAPGSLTAADPVSGVNNGLALDLAALGSANNDAGQVNGLGFVQFYGKMAAEVGATAALAERNVALQRDLVTQAQNLRAQRSSVSLNEEAMKVLQFQRSYEAVAKMIRVVDELTRTIIDTLR